MAAVNILEATIDDIHGAYRSGAMTCRGLVKAYLDRIAKFDKHGPAINALITVNFEALDEAERLDAAYKASGPVGSLHGIPVIIKDQADVKGMPTTLGSLVFKNYCPDRDSFVADKLRKRARSFWAKPHSVNWAAAIRMARSSARRAILMIQSAPSADLPVVRPHPSPRISRPWPWDRKVWPRSAGHPPGTASPACVLPPVL